MTGHDDQDSKLDDAREPSYWLMKSEPDSRIENGINVKFSIDDLEASDGPVGWDGKVNPFPSHVDGLKTLNLMID